MAEFEQVSLMQVLMERFATCIGRAEKDDEKTRGGKRTEFWTKSEQKLKVLFGLMFTLTVIFVFINLNFP